MVMNHGPPRSRRPTPFLAFLSRSLAPSASYGPRGPALRTRASGPRHERRGRPRQPSVPWKWRFRPWTGWPWRGLFWKQMGWWSFLGCPLVGSKWKAKGRLTHHSGGSHLKNETPTCVNLRKAIHLTTGGSTDRVSDPDGSCGLKSKSVAPFAPLSIREQPVFVGYRKIVIPEFPFNGTGFRLPTECVCVCVCVFFQSRRHVLQNLNRLFFGPQMRAK